MMKLGKLFTELLPNLNVLQLYKIAWIEMHL